MKKYISYYQVLAACLSAASASSALYGAGVYAGNYAEPSFYGLTSYPNGAVVPVDEPAVAAARAEHLSLKAPLAYAAAPAVGVETAYNAYASPVAVAAPVSYGYSGPLHIPSLVAHPNGAVTPADEPAVVAARAEHLAAQADAYNLAAPVAYAAAAPAVAPVAYAAGVPAVASPVSYGYSGPLHIPTLVAHPNGAVTPADEPAVAAARAEHLAAYGGVYGGVYGAASPAVGYAAGYASGYPVGLVAYPNGAVVPVDEPAVAAARAEHLAAKGGIY